MRPKPMKPHVACRCCEFEKHLRGLCHAAVWGNCLREEAVAENVRIMIVYFERSSDAEIKLCCVTRLAAVSALEVRTRSAEVVVQGISYENSTASYSAAALDVYRRHLGRDAGAGTYESTCRDALEGAYCSIAGGNW